jgi:hypothetical protein
MSVKEMRTFLIGVTFHVIGEENNVVWKLTGCIIHLILFTVAKLRTVRLVRYVARILKRQIKHFGRNAKILGSHSCDYEHCYILCCKAVLFDVSEKSVASGIWDEE